MILMKGILAILLVVSVALAFNPLSVKPLKHIGVDPASDFVKGLLEGIHETKTVEDVFKCLKDIEPILEKIKAALELFKKMTFSDIVKGFNLLNEALHDLFKMLGPCLEGFTQVEKLMEAIKNMDVVKMVMKILVNPGAFIKDVMDCIEAFKQLNFYLAGKYEGDILYRLFLSRSVSSNPILDFVIGFLEGIKEVKTVDDLLKCMKNADQILDKIKRALKMLQNFSFDDILKGLSMLFEALLELEQMLKPCLEGFTQFKKLMYEIAHVDLYKVIMKILSDPVPYFEDFNDCIEALTNGDFKQAGTDMGDILYRLFLVVELPGDHIVDFLKGFLEGLNEKGDINELLKCLKNLEEILSKIKQALEYIKQKDPVNLIKGLTLLFEAVSELLTVLKPCSSGFDQLKKLFEAFQHINLMKLVFKILANPGPYIQDVVNCIEAFKNNNYYDAGKCLGDFLYRLFLASVSHKGLLATAKDAFKNAFMGFL